jgi:hypothetical protein
MIRDCRRCGGPLESDLAGSGAGVMREVLVCRCGYQEDAPRVPLTRHEVLERIAVVKARQR